MPHLSNHFWHPTEVCPKSRNDSCQAPKYFLYYRTMLFWLVFRDTLQVNHTCKLLLLCWNIKYYVWFCPVQTKHKFTLTSSFCGAVRGDPDVHVPFLSFSHQRGEANLRSCQDPALTSDSGWSTHATQEQKDFHGASPHNQSEFCSQEHFLSKPSDPSSWPSHVGDGRWVHLIHASGQDDQGALLRHLAIWWYIVHTLCHTLCLCVCRLVDE